MSLKIGIVGLPNVGKSTLFNALTKKGSAQASNFPFTTIDPNVGIVDLPDERLDTLAAIVHPERIVPATVTFVDIAGLVRGAHKGEGLGNKFLANIREVDAIALVLRDFSDPNVTHVGGAVDPIEDLQTIQTELILKDLESVEKKLESIQGTLRSGDKEAQALAPLLDRLKTGLEHGTLASSLPYTSDERELLQSLQLLTAKPLLVVLNVDEDRLRGAGARIGELMPALFPTPPEHLPLRSSAAAERRVVPISAKVEAELVELDAHERDEYLAELGLTEPGLNRLIRQAFDLLGLATYFTAGPQEVRAWTIHQGTKAPQAAGVIHTDFERGFIKAEVIGYDDYVGLGGEQGARTAGKLRLEGKDYTVADGDVIHFRFNV